MMRRGWEDNGGFCFGMVVHGSPIYGFKEGREMKTAFTAAAAVYTN